MDVDELYGLPLDRFTPERNALAKELRGAGRREEAANVAGLRKPSVAAWAVNQLVRTQRRAVGELFEAGDALRAAHEQVLSGRGDGGTLRAAVELERAAVEALADAARGLLTSDGHELSPAIIDRVTDTLHAAALDDDARARVQDGRLERELRHVGLGTAPSAGAAATLAPAPARAREARAPKQRADDRAAEDRAARERAEARSAARATEREARRRVERAERAARAAAERRERAARALEEAKAELGDAEVELEEARDQLGDAERAVRELAE